MAQRLSMASTPTEHWLNMEPPAWPQLEVEVRGQVDLMFCHTVIALVLMYSEEAGEKEREEEEEEGGGELTLAQQFEQIRRCRYIRHYRPDGTAMEDTYDYKPRH